MQRPDQRGFTLIEVLAALAVFAIAAAALLRVAGSNASTAYELERRALAHVVAENAAVEAAFAVATSTETALSGEETIGDRQFFWRVALYDTADPDLVRIEASVREAGDEQVIAAIQQFRRR